MSRGTRLKKGTVKRSRDLAYLLLFNRFTVGLIVFVVGVGFVIIKALDNIFHLKLRRFLSAAVHDASRDSLTVVRKAQISYLFRRKYKLGKVRMTLAGGSYWMSIPVIVSGIDRNKKERKYMGKIIDDASILKHRYMTLMRNLGVLVSGAGLTFDEHVDAKDMVEYERDSLINLKKQGVNVPEVYGVHRLNDGDYMLVMEFIEGRPLSRVELTDAIIEQIFATLKTMHDNGAFHGDVKLDNFLYAGCCLVVVDCLKIHEGDTRNAQDFDLICALCALAQKMPVPEIIELALKYHSEEELRRSCRLIGVALNKVDLDLSAEQIKEIVDRLGAKEVAPVPGAPS
jgi:serine/threonine protein kinase